MEKKTIMLIGAAALGVMIIGIVAVVIVRRGSDEPADVAAGVTTGSNNPQGGEPTQTNPTGTAGGTQPVGPNGGPPLTAVGPAAVSAVPDNKPAPPDYDHDGLSDAQEAQYKTDPQKKDTDGDNLSDSYEVLFLKTNPLDKNDPPDHGMRGGKLPPPIK